MNVAVMEFFVENVVDGEFIGKRVLEVGSKYVNGSVRPLIKKSLSPKEYVGTDIEPGKFVDIVLPAENLLNYFGHESFDVVISSEVLEHVKNWRLVVNNMKNVLRRGGYLYITTRSRARLYHGYPYDFWRYEVEDFRNIFSDFKILVLSRDHMLPGVFLKAQKPCDYAPKALDNISPYSTVIGRRTSRILDVSDMPLIRKLILILRRAPFVRHMFGAS